MSKSTWWIQKGTQVMFGDKGPFTVERIYLSHQAAYVYIRHNSLRRGMVVNAEEVRVIKKGKGNER